MYTIINNIKCQWINKFNKSGIKLAKIIARQFAMKTNRYCIAL